jgi:hypothetical protein
VLLHDFDDGAEREGAVRQAAAPEEPERRECLYNYVCVVYSEVWQR